LSIDGRLDLMLVQQREMTFQACGLTPLYLVSLGQSWFKTADCTSQGLLQ
jgi:hypothetical protein